MVNVNRLAKFLKQSGAGLKSTDAADPRFAQLVGEMKQQARDLIRAARDKGYGDDAVADVMVAAIVAALGRAHGR
jgi:hypothetical protein